MRRPLQSPALINAFYDSLRPEQRETCMAMQRAILSVARARAKGRVVSSLEGGYDLQALGRSAAAHVRALQEG